MGCISRQADVSPGDERPCQRCIKRGLQDACHDGVRKKAKYLHDAPNEALMPGIRGSLYGQNNAMRNNLPLSRNGVKSSYQKPNTNFYPSQQTPTTTYGVYPQTKSQAPIAPPLLQ